MATLGQDNSFDDYSYVMLSTDNQLINYIPLSIYKFKKIILITTKRKENIEWDENLKSIFNPSLAIETITCSSLAPDSVKDDISKKLNIKNPGEKIFWNITGGQRPLSIAIGNIVNDYNRVNDILFYYEGNEEKIYLYKNNELLDESIKVDLKNKLSTQDALKLKGFDYNSSLSIGDIKNKTFYLNLYDSYIKDSIFRNKIRKLNSDRNFISIITNDYPKIDFLNQLKIEHLENISALFGHLLERMIFCYLHDKYSSKFVGVEFSVKINFRENRIDKYSIDEIDILLHTAEGKIKNLEIKSGKVKGDNLKSHNYTTFAISGIYGDPILITPLLVNEQKNPENEEYFDSIEKAEKAKLKNWYIDKLDEEIKIIVKN